MGSETQTNQPKIESEPAANGNGDGDDVVMEDAEAPKSAASKGAGTSQADTKNAKQGSTNGATASSGTGAASVGSKEGGENGSTSGGAKAGSPPPPVLRGTLTYNMELRRHLIRGNWNYENSNSFPAQRFELLRTLGPDEDPKDLPKDGEFHGSFSLAYFHITSKKKQKERSKIITESGVNIKFTPREDSENGKKSFNVDGKGTNKFGVFHINGIATASAENGNDQYDVVLRKRYEPAPAAAATATGGQGGKQAKKRKLGKSSEKAAVDEGPLPPPSKSFEKGVVCLRGKLHRKESTPDISGLGVGEVIHHVHGMWAPGLDLILADPDNKKGFCNKFEYEHKSSVASVQSPVSGRYSGWFELTQEDGTKATINERDITLRFRKNNAGHHNIEGKGSNVFGRYSITGTLTAENVITIFRHFQPRKIKPSKPVTPAPPPINTPGQSRRPSLPSVPEPKLKLDDVEVPDTPAGELETLKTPENTAYSAVSRGVLRVNDDGSHVCQGRWAMTRDHFTNGQTSNFTFRLEPHFVQEAIKAGDRTFPVDSALYKGSFQLRKQGTRPHNIVDHQVVMRFRQNAAGSFNVYGKGVNDIGGFNLSGTLILIGKSSGQVELYRVYPPAELAPTDPVKAATVNGSVGKALKSKSDTVSSSKPTAVPPAKVARRESSRTVKLPTRFEDDDPQAQLARIMEKCNQILRFIREKDVELGAFFSEKVDPVALGIPTYSEVIKEPMDLGTIRKRMEANQIKTPEEFARLCRLVFENAMTFNVDPNHSVHQAARSLLIVFNQKYREIDPLLQVVRKSIPEQPTKVTTQKKKGANDRKRKKVQDEVKSQKKRRQDEARQMAASNQSALAAIAAAASSNVSNANVSRAEFNLLLELVQQLQRQIVQTHNAVAELSSDDIDRTTTAVVAPPVTSSTPVAAPTPAPAPAPTPKPQKKKTPAKKPKEPEIDDDRPLTWKEQELLTETINELDPMHQAGVVQIIREAANLADDEDQIDLGIDQLDNRTQRKLLRHVSKFIKQPKRKQAKTQRKSGGGRKPVAKKADKTTPAAKAKVPQAPAPAPEPAPKPKEDPDSFFAFGGEGNSDSESDGEISEGPSNPPASRSNRDASADASTRNGKPGGGSSSKDAGKSEKGSEFKLGGSFGFGQDDEEEDEDEEEGGMAATWNITSTKSDAEDNDGDEDDGGWAMARQELEASKAREEDRKKREEKQKVEAEMAQKQRMADAERVGEEIRARQMKEKEREAKLLEEQERKAEEQRKAAREAARAKIQSVEQTVDLDEQRDIMKEYEQSYMDKELGGGSPSSDFGF